MPVRLGPACHRYRWGIYETSDNIVKSMALKSIGDLDTPEANEFVRNAKQSKDYGDDTIREVVDLYQ